MQAKKDFDGSNIINEDTLKNFKNPKFYIL